MAEGRMAFFVERLKVIRRIIRWVERKDLSPGTPGYIEWHAMIHTSLNLLQSVLLGKDDEIEQYTLVLYNQLVDFKSKKGDDFNALR